MAKTKGYQKSKGRGQGRFISIPHSVLDSEQGKNLKGNEMLLLTHLLKQYNGSNNGNLSTTFSLLKNNGWSSTGTLYKARQGLEHKGFIVVTRQGKKLRGACTLVAITWIGIDDCIKWNYDDGVKVSPAPLNYFKIPKENWGVQPTTKPPK